MRLWHLNLIHKLPRQQLLGQWRECIALLGKGWGRKHKTVDYVFLYPEGYLIAYSCIVYKEMQSRGYKPDLDKIQMALRKRLTYKEIDDQWNLMYQVAEDFKTTKQIYKEHDNQYYTECIRYLESKGINI